MFNEEMGNEWLNNLSKFQACEGTRWANVQADPARGCNPKPHALHD